MTWLQEPGPYLYAEWRDQAGNTVEVDVSGGKVGMSFVNPEGSLVRDDGDEPGSAHVFMAPGDACHFAEVLVDAAHEADR